LATKSNDSSQPSCHPAPDEVNEKSIFFGPEGPVTVQMTRKWTLSPDGKTLRSEIAVDGPQGKQQVKRTFIRK
jgi:hypothetical protein